MSKNTLENKVYSVVSKILITPYNWSLILTTILLWAFEGAVFRYSANANFDMSVLVNGYIGNISLLAIAIGFLSSIERHKILINLGFISYLLSLFAIVMSKTLFAQGWFGTLVVTPLSMFCFLILIKNIWILRTDVEANQKGS
jgi:hypothetical protein